MSCPAAAWQAARAGLPAKAACSGRRPRPFGWIAAACVDGLDRGGDSAAAALTGGAGLMSTRGMHTRSLAILRSAAALVLALAAGGTAAQAGETAPITIVVPFAAAGPTDAVARALAPGLSAALAEPVTVRNHAGAGGTAGADAVARAPADGRTLLLHHVGMATAPVLYRQLPYEPQRDFVPLGRVVDVAMTLVARADFPGRTGAEALRTIRRGQADLLVAYAGLGAASHLCGLLLADALGVDLIQIPYRGTGPAMVDLIDGKVDLLCDQTTTTTKPLQEGRIKGLAITSPSRVAGLPDLPTVAELGLPGLQLTIWHGLYAPAGTPAPVVDRLARALQATLRDPRFVAEMARIDGVLPGAGEASPDALRRLLATETRRWTPVLRRTGQFAD